MRADSAMEPRYADVLVIVFLREVKKFQLDVGCIHSAP
jgi:hypothetical protein